MEQPSSNWWLNFGNFAGPSDSSDLCFTLLYTPGAALAAVRMKRDGWSVEAESEAGSGSRLG